MTHDRKPRSAPEAYAHATDTHFLTEELSLGPWTSYSMIHDPKHLVFALSRYKFHAKMLAARESVLEVGPGDGIGLPIMAQTVKRIVAVDWDACLIEGNRRRLKHLTNVEHLCVDLSKQPIDVKVDAVMTVDVIEHLEPQF
jgi:protein-L-isoaspartate O-methyltransferase